MQSCISPLAYIGKHEHWSKEEAVRLANELLKDSLCETEPLKFRHHKTLNTQRKAKRRAVKAMHRYFGPFSLLVERPVDIFHDSGRWILGTTTTGKYLGGSKIAVLDSSSGKVICMIGFK